MAKAAPIRDRDWPRTVAAFEGWPALQPERWTDVAAQPGRDAPARLAARSRRDVAMSAKGPATATVGPLRGCESHARLMGSDEAGTPATLRRYKTADRRTWA